MSTRESDLEGVQFREIDGRRSSQRVAREVFAAAADAVDAGVGARIRATKDWRKSYTGPLRELVAAGTRTADAPTAMADAGITALHASMEFVRGGRGLAVGEALVEHGKPQLTTQTVEGDAEPDRRVAIPYRDEVLVGDRLLGRLDRWVSDGVIEPSCAEAVRAVVANPDWLDLSDLRFVLLGAASEMGPLRALCNWGADVIAIDLPRPALWERITQIARAGAGRVHVPVPLEGAATDLTVHAGVDLLTQTPEVATLLHDLGGPFVVGNYVYADGATFVRLATAVDVLAESLRTAGRLAALAYLATPTDVFAVTPEVVEGARSNDRSSRGAILRAVSVGRLYRRQYQSMVTGGEREWGVYDCLVPQQGPNYALAKTLQKMACGDCGACGRARVGERGPRDLDPLGSQEPDTCCGLCRRRQVWRRDLRAPDQQRPRGRVACARPPYRLSSEVASIRPLRRGRGPRRPVADAPRAALGPAAGGPQGLRSPDEALVRRDRPARLVRPAAS